MLPERNFVAHGQVKSHNPYQDTRQAGYCSMQLDHGMLVFHLSLKLRLSVGPLAASLAFPGPYQH